MSILAPIYKTCSIEVKRNAYIKHLTNMRCTKCTIHVVLKDYTCTDIRAFFLNDTNVHLNGKYYLSIVINIRYWVFCFQTIGLLLCVSFCHLKAHIISLLPISTEGTIYVLLHPSYPKCLSASPSIRKTSVYVVSENIFKRLSCDSMLLWRAIWGWCMTPF